MSDHYDAIIGDAERKLESLEAESKQIRLFINQVLEFAGRPARFNPEDLKSSGSAKVATMEISRNEFYGKPLATCVKGYLERRESTQGKVREASLDDIIDALETGGYDLRRHGGDKDSQKRGVAISLAKNTLAFHKLPNGDIGLVEWYQSVLARKERRGRPEQTAGETPDPTDETVSGDDQVGDEAGDAQESHTTRDEDIF